MQQIHTITPLCRDDKNYSFTQKHLKRYNSKIVAIQHNTKLPINLHTLIFVLSPAMHLNSK